MMLYPVIKETIALLRADATLVDLLGGASIYRNRTRKDIKIPGVYYRVVYDGVSENYAPNVIQWDIWAHNQENLTLIHQRLYELMHHDLPVQYGDLRLWSQYESAYDFEEQDQGIYHRAVDFRYTPARENG